MRVHKENTTVLKIHKNYIKCYLLNDYINFATLAVYGYYINIEKKKLHIHFKQKVEI